MSEDNEVACGCGNRKARIARTEAEGLWEE